MKKTDPHWGTSLRRPKLSRGSKQTRKLVSKTIEDWHGKKHRLVSDEEIELINSLKAPDCPFCGCEPFTKEGKLSSGIVRCRCSGCGRRFNPLAETIFDSRKIPISERIEYLLHMLEFHSVRTSARDNKNDGKTGAVWLFQLFSVLKGYRDGIVLSGTVWADEAFTPANPAERVALPGGKKPRGAFQERDLHRHGGRQRRARRAFPRVKGQAVGEAILAALGGRVKRRSHLIHDGDNSHSILVESLELVSETHKSSETRGMPDRLNPMDKANDLHGRLQEFLGSHPPSGRGNLQGWLDLFAFIYNPPANRHDKVVLLLERAVKVRGRVKFRDIFPEKPDDDEEDDHPCAP